MITLLLDTLSTLFGIAEDSVDFDFWQVAARATLVYLAALVFVRLASKRFMGRNSAFDLLLGVMLGSVLSRGITGQISLLNCVAASGTLLLVHWILGAVAARFGRFGAWIKGRRRILIEDGKVDFDAMVKSHFGKEDLAEALRTHGLISPEEVRVASLERSGKVSVVPEEGSPEIVEVRVEDGVQTVRIEIGGKAR